MTIIKNISRFLGWLLGFIVPKGMPKLLRAVRSNLYTGFLAHSFLRLGRGTVIAYRTDGLRGLHRVSIAENCQIESGLQLTAWETDENKGREPLITIGRGCKLRKNAHLSALNGITIGDNLLTGTNVLITDNAHGSTATADLQLPPESRRVVSKGAIRIGNNVWLGNNVCVMPGVTIGDGAVIGANSVVTRDIPEYSVAVGVPAQVLKKTNSK